MPSPLHRGRRSQFCNNAHENTNISSFHPTKVLGLLRLFSGICSIAFPIPSYKPFHSLAEFRVAEHRKINSQAPASVRLQFTVQLPDRVAHEGFITGKVS